MKHLFQKAQTLASYRWLPWVIAALVIVAALLHEIFQPAWLATLPKSYQAGVWVVVLFSLLPLYLGIERLVGYPHQRELLQHRAETAEGSAALAYQRLEAIFRISQKFVEASDEEEVIQLVLRLSVDLVGASGAAFVPLDELGQSQAAIQYGRLPSPGMGDWVEYLATPAVRQRCQSCEAHGHFTSEASCPLLKGPFSEAAGGMFCLPLRRGEREFGVLTLFLPNVERLDSQTQSFLQAMVDETALALEGVRLRRRELAALQQMHLLRQRSDVKTLLRGQVENVYRALEADFAVLLVPEPGNCLSRVDVLEGALPPQSQAFIDGLLQSVLQSAQPLILGEVSGDPATKPGVRSLMAAPLLTSERSAVGALLVGSRRPESFHPRQLALLQTIAGQVSLVVQNANLMADLEYKTVIQERTRLAREIHDGLAQTLGFLKLQAAQMQNYLARGDEERLRQSIDLCYATLTEAYQDARQAIDGLRISPGDSGLLGWLEQAVAEFEDLSGLTGIVLEAEVTADLPSEIHVQLIRIVQEALGNVRKHAQAKQVWVTCHEEGGDLWLEIRDDGLGFASEDVPGPSRHGLRGMRERAELIGADFQVVSRPGEGTTVRVRLPLVNLGLGVKPE